MHKDMITQLDSMIMREILVDIQNGTLLTKADNATLKLVMLNIWEMKELFSQLGVIIADA